MRRICVMTSFGRSTAWRVRERTTTSKESSPNSSSWVSRSSSTSGTPLPMAAMTAPGSRSTPVPVQSMAPMR